MVTTEPDPCSLGWSLLWFGFFYLYPFQDSRIRLHGRELAQRFLLHLRCPVELTPSQPVQFHLGRSMISMNVVNEWNRRLLRAISRRGTYTKDVEECMEGDYRSTGSNDGDVRISNGDGNVTKSVCPCEDF